jgi:hypothetical protein
MSREPGGDELRARTLLHAHDVHPFGHAPQEPAMPAPPDPEWWRRAPKHDEPQPADPEPPAPPAPPASAEQAPGVHVHITQTPAPQPDTDPAETDRRRRIRRWWAYNGSAAAAGWALQLDAVIREGLLEPLGNSATPAGIALAGFAWVGAEFVASGYLRLLPARLHPPVLWVLRIPMATALLATALNTPNALT